MFEKFKLCNLSCLYYFLKEKFFVSNSPHFEIFSFSIINSKTKSFPQNASHFYCPFLRCKTCSYKVAHHVVHTYCRRRIELEDKAKVVCRIGAQNPCPANVLHRVFFLNKWLNSTVPPCRAICGNTPV